MRVVSSVSLALWVYQPIRIRPPFTGVSASTESDAVSREVAAVAATPGGTESAGELTTGDAAGFVLLLVVLDVLVHRWNPSFLSLRSRIRPIGGHRQMRANSTGPLDAAPPKPKRGGAGGPRHRPDESRLAIEAAGVTAAGTRRVRAAPVRDPAPGRSPARSRNVPSGPPGGLRRERPALPGGRRCRGGRRSDGPARADAPGGFSTSHVPGIMRGQRVWKGQPVRPMSTMSAIERLHHELLRIERHVRHLQHELNALQVLLVAMLYVGRKRLPVEPDLAPRTRA